MQMQPLTKSEEKLMLFLWEQGRPLSVLEMLEASDNNAWTKNYTRDIVRALEEKGAVEFHSLDRRANRYARRFVPAYTKEAYYAQLAKRNGVSVSKMFQAEAVAMVRKGDKEGMEELIRELEEIIEEYRERDEE